MADAPISISPVAGAPADPAACPERAPRFFGFTLAGDEKAPGALELAVCRRVAFLAILAYFALGAFLVLYSGARLIPNQWENTYPESPHVWAALHAAETGRLYVPYTQSPYVLQSYGPLYYVLNATMAMAVHADLHQNIQLFVIVARSVTFVCFLACGALIFLICRRLSISRGLAALATVMLFGQPSFFHFIVTVRPDMMFLAAMALSLFVAVAQESPEPWTCALAGALGGVAFLIKQPGAAVVVAIALVWMLHQRFKQTFLLLAGAATPVILLLAALLLRHERYFLPNYMTVGKAYWSLPNGLNFLADSLYNLEMIVPIGIALIGAARALQAGERAQLIVSFAAVNWLVGLSGAPQVGSSANYFFAGLIGCALLLPFAVMAVRENAKSVAALVLIVWGVCHVIGIESNWGNTVLATQLNVARDPYRAFANYHVLSDRPVFSLHGRDPDLLDPLSAHIMEVAGNWSSAPIAAQLRRGAYDFVILGCSGDRAICSYRGVSFFSADVVRAINDNYALFCSNHGDTVFTPRLRTVNASPEVFTPAFGQPCDTKFQGQAPDLFIVNHTR